MSEIDKLLNELRNMKSYQHSKHIENNAEIWSKIARKDLEGLGFDNEEELKSWILENPYCNI